MAKKSAANGVAVVERPRVSGNLPLYADPRAVHSDAHRDVGVRVGPADYAFAGRTPMVQVTVDEFERAALDYPIVFFGADRQPYVVTGLEPDRNLFVTDGWYRTAAYIPAYLRRYPFVFAQDEGSDALILCLDHASDRVAAKGEPDTQALFEDEAPTATTRQALQFCEGYEAANRRTRAFVALVEELALLEGKQAHYAAPGAQTPTLLLDYWTIDRAKLDALSPDGLAKLREAGFLAAVYGVVASQAQWEILPLLGA